MFIKKIAYWQKKCQVLKIFKIGFSSRKKFYKIYLSCLQNASFSRITDSTSRALFKIQVVVTKLKLVWCLGHAKYSRVLIKSSRSRGMAVKFCKIFSDLKNRFWKFSELNIFLLVRDLLHQNAKFALFWVTYKFVLVHQQNFKVFAQPVSSGSGVICAASI